MKRRLFHFGAVVFFGLCITISTSAQQRKQLTPAANGKSTESAELTSPIEQYRDKKEDVSKRDLYAKHFINDDGSYTAVIGAGPIHYEKNGQFYDIDQTITSHSSLEYPYANETNLIASYFGASANTGIKSLTADGELWEFLNTKMYWDVNGEAVNMVLGADVEVSIADNRAMYSNLFGSISAEFIIDAGRRKQNYLIPNIEALANRPSNANYLVFSEQILLPEGWSYVEGRAGVEIKNSSGKTVFVYDYPSVIEDYPNEVNTMVMDNPSKFELTLNDNILTVLLKVDCQWLLESNRIFPIAIDPTVYPFNVVDATGQCFPTGGGSGNPFVGYSGGWYRSWSVFDISSLPSLNSTQITSASVSLHVRVKTGTHSALNTVRLGHSKYDFISSTFFPSYQLVYSRMIAAANTDGGYGDVSPTAGVNTWTTVNLPAIGYTHIAQKSGSDMAFFPISMTPTWGTGTTARSIGFYGYADATRKPYLTIEYSDFDIYCRPGFEFANCAGYNDCMYIGVSNVNLGSINNTTTFNNTPTGYNNYAETQMTELSSGSSYTLTATYRDGGGNTGNIAAWIDWNMDGDFDDPNEFLGIVSGLSNTNVASIPFTVPGISSGTTRLRIRSSYDDVFYSATDACTDADYGETEDYGITLSAPSLVCAALDNLVASIGTPTNGLNHHLNLAWTALAGATNYDVQFSTDGSLYQNPVTASSVSTNSTILDAGDNPNMPFWFRVRATDGIQTCEWTYVGPIYTAADIPAVPVITNAAGTSLEVTLQNETPAVNPASTEYSIYCTTTSQYVQANGTLGTTEVFQTKAAWGTTTVTGLTINTNYCFYAKAKNGDGHIVSGEVGISGIETFTTTANFSNAVSTGPNDKWWTPGSPTSGVPMSFNSSGGCDGGYIGFSGSFNNFFGSFLRSPSQNCTGLNTVTMTFDLSNSYFASHTQDRIYFNMWAPTAAAPTGTYINAATVNGVNTSTLYFSEVRNCQSVVVTFNLATVTDKSAIRFYLNVNCDYNDSNVFSFKLDDISMSQPAPTACATVAASPTPVFYNYGGSTQLAFNNSRSDSDTPVFRLSHGAGNSATDYQIEINTSPAFNGTAITQTFNGSYLAGTQQNFTFSNATGQLVSGTTYYVRARINTGLGYGFWTTNTYSFTYNVSNTELDWFQTTQAQFQTGTLGGAEANVSHNVVASSVAGASFVNPSFETSSNWTTFATGGSPMTVTLSDGANWSSLGSRAARMYMFGGFALGSDIAVVSQVVDLTNIEQIIFDAQSHYGQNFTSSLANGGTLRLIIGGTSSNATGTTVATINHCASGSSSCTVQSLNQIANIPLAQRLPNQIVKFVWTGFSQGDLGGALVHFMVDNVRTTTASAGSITSPTIYRASKQNTATWENLTWTQTLNGGTATLGLQEVVGGSWTAIAGYDNISIAGDGLKTFDISALSNDSIRVVATLAGTTSPILHDWSMKAGGCAAPEITTNLSTSVIGCTTNNIALSVVSEGQANTYQWQLSTNGGSTWSNINNGGKYSGATSSVLNISSLIIGMSGYQYQVVITNECGTVTSAAAALTVQVCPSNDSPAPNNPSLSSLNYVYPNCFNVPGTTVGATINLNTGTRDVWYQFVAISNGISIKVTSTQIDPVIYLFNASASTLLDEESVVTGTGAEILNFGGLVAGQTYRIAVASENATDGTFSICAQQLRIPNCGTEPPYGLCSAFKSTVTGATTTTYSFTQGANTTTTTATNPITLGQSSLQLSYGGSYSVGLIANYVLQDGNGQSETIQVSNPTACSIVIDQHPLLEVKSNQRCINGAVLYRNSYLLALPGGATICGVTGYRVEFTPVSNCNGDNPQNLETFSKTITSPTASMSLNYAFNHLTPTTAYPHIGYWLVRWKPRFGNIEGQYDNGHVVAVNGTSSTPPSGMMAESTEQISGLVSTSNVEANIYPNPNNGDMVNLNMTGITTDNVHVRIMDSMGRVVYTNRYTVDGSLNIIVTFSKPLAGGLYMVEFTSGTEVITQRMMVTR